MRFGDRQEFIDLRLGHPWLDGKVVLRQGRRTLRSRLVLLHLLGGDANAVGIRAMEAFHERMSRIVRSRGNSSLGEPVLIKASRTSAADRASPAARGEVLQAAHPVTKLVPSLLNRVASPAAASFGQAGAAAAEFGGHLGQEQSALRSGQPAGSRPDQDVEARDGVWDHGGTPWWRDGRQSAQSLASVGRAGSLSSG